MGDLTEATLLRITTLLRQIAKGERAPTAVTIDVASAVLLLKAMGKEI